MAGYPLLPLPTAYRSPSGQVGQIQIDGLVEKVTLFHGSSDDELDWHIYLDTRSDAATLANYLVTNGVDASRSDFDQLYCEIMVLEDYDTPSWVAFWDRDNFYSADFELPFRLAYEGSATPARSLGQLAMDHRGTGQDVSRYSRLPGGRVYLQGSFVNDAAHGTLPEIHPLDSIAFAMDGNGRTVAASWGDPDWPQHVVTWRVGVFGNSSLHRINGESFMRTPRTTTWYLDLPGAAPARANRPPGHFHDSVAAVPYSVEEKQHALKHKGEDLWFPGHGVHIWPGKELAIDPADGRLKLKVTTTMSVPDKLGGIVVRDYTIRFQDQFVTG